MYGTSVALLVRNPSTCIQSYDFMRWHLVGRNERMSRMLDRHPF